VEEGEDELTGDGGNEGEGRRTDLDAFPLESLQRKGRNQLVSTGVRAREDAP
jgi:hypothetical protein